MSCADCAAAAAVEHWGFAAGCRGCCARAAARSPQYRRVAEDGFLDREYRRLLSQFGLQHAEVRAAAQADKYSLTEVRA